MNNFITKIFNFFIERKILAFSTAFIFVNLIALSYLIHSTRVSKQSLVHQILVEKVIATIMFVSQKPIDQRKSAIDAMQLSYSSLAVSQSNKPRWPLRLTTLSSDQLNDILLQETEPLAISILLNDGKWLNVNVYRFNHLAQTQFLILSAVETIVILGLLLFSWSSHRFVRPIANFKEAVERIGKDLKNAQLISINGPEIVREAAHAVNETQQRIRDLIASRIRMLAAISHDLRTPITRMRLRAQFVAQPDIQASLIENLDEMNKMITEILAFAKADAKTGKKSPCDLVSLLEVICNDADTGWDVTFITNLQRAPFLGHVLSLKRAFINLIDNATRYGKKAQVRLYRYLNTISITITDEGPGIPIAEQKNVFKPFQRGIDETTQSNTSGMGLGLAIAYDIIQAHNGAITLKNLRGGGLQVRVKL